jgi:hypothetical protein
MAGTGTSGGILSDSRSSPDQPAATRCLCQAIIGWEYRLLPAGATVCSLQPVPAVDCVQASTVPRVVGAVIISSLAASELPVRDVQPGSKLA